MKYFFLTPILCVMACELPPAGVATAPSTMSVNVDGPDAGTAVGAGPPARSSRRLRRLGNREYNNVVRDLLGDSTQPADGFLGDGLPSGYDNGAVDLVVQPDRMGAMVMAAEGLASDTVTNRRDRLLGGCDAALDGESACFTAFMSTFAPRAFRRPLTHGESARITAVYEDGRAAGGFALGLEVALEVILQSPAFLYREELGTPAGAWRVNLTPYELASELSFLVTGSLPDDTLWAAVTSGRFETAGDRRREAARLLATPPARANMGAFLHEWLATNRLTPTVTTKSPALYPSWSPALEAAMTAELDWTFEHTVFDGAGSLRALMTTPDSYVDASLAALYGVAAPEAGSAPVTLDPATRGGVLSRAGFLASHASYDSSGPIARGVFLMSAALCHAPITPPPNIPAPPSVDDTAKAGQTTRARFAQHTQDSSCRPCHRVIDGIGFGFEGYDGIGAYRTTENGQPVDVTGNLVGTGDPDVDGPYEGVTGFTERLLTGRVLSNCFARQVYRFAMGTGEDAEDAATVEALAAGFDVDARITDLVLALVTDPSFATRRTVTMAEAAP